MLAECKQSPDFPVTCKSTLSKWCKKLGFCYKWSNKKMEVYQYFDVDIVPPACNFIKDKTPAQLFSCELC